MTNLVTKPIVVVTHILLSVDNPTQFFAVPEEGVKIPDNAAWVGLVDSEKCYLELHPVVESDSEGIEDFKADLEVAVDFDNSFFPSWTLYHEIKDWRWFAELNE